MREAKMVAPSGIWVRVRVAISVRVMVRVRVTIRVRATVTLISDGNQ